MNLPDDLANALEGKLYDLMYRHQYNLNGPDESVCDFCHNAAYDIKGKHQAIAHAPDCLGVRLQAEFDNAR